MKRYLMIISLCLLLLIPAMTGCGPSHAQIERREFIANHKSQCEAWEKAHRAFLEEWNTLDENHKAFRRGLSNVQVDKIQRCEQYQNRESCDDFIGSLDETQKSKIRRWEFESKALAKRYNGIRQWGKDLARDEQNIKDDLAADRENRVAMAQMIGAWSVSNQLMLMNNTLNSMRGTMLFNRPLR